jgi:carboxymethylenebutenolidase
MKEIGIMDTKIDATSAPDSTSAPSRREAMKLAASVGVGLGFAAAVLPVQAQSVIQTSADGLQAGWVNIDVGGFAMRAYRAAPAGRSNLPVVMVVPEIFGVHEHICDVTRRLAHQGYLAIAPDLMQRQGDPSTIGEVAKIISEVVSKVPDVQVMQDLDATFDWATRNGGDIQRVAITGFCWGGRIVWMYTARHTRLRAAAAWYGQVNGKRGPLTPTQPVDLMRDLHAPTLGLYGGADTGIPAEHVEMMRAALQSRSDAAQDSVIHVYPDVPHAFHADYRPSYRKEAAQDGWARMLAWFRQYGAA